MVGDASLWLLVEVLGKYGVRCCCITVNGGGRTGGAVMFFGGRNEGMQRMFEAEMKLS